MDCLFCSIANKNTPSEVIYENEQAIAFLDAQPRAPGHTLVIPKKHAANVLDADTESLYAVILTIQHTTGILNASLNPVGFTIGINHGKEAGQFIGHLHAHILPRFKGDDGSSIHFVVNNPPTESVKATADYIRQKKV